MSGRRLHAVSAGGASGEDGLRICPSCVRRSWLLATLAPHLEVVRGRRGAVREVLALPNDELVHALDPHGARAVLDAAERLDLHALRATWGRAGTTAICRHAPGYPAGLLDASDPPFALHVYGASEHFGALLGPDARAVAIVGSRRASPDGAEIAAGIARGLSAAGITVISGMAMGIDAAAHRGALSAGARTVAVLASGPEIASPARESRLHRELHERALVISELPPGTRPWTWAFPARNRIIAGLAQMTVIVEAAERSGSLITAEIAADLGRDVGAVPGSPLSWRSAGSNALLRDGAQLIRSAADVVDEVIGLSADPAAPREPASLRPVGLAPALLGLLEDIDGGRDSVAALAAAPRPVGSVLAGLSELELLGHVRRDLSGRYSRVRA